ncbi:hypothetical protein [Paenibacillus aceris]|uniref:Uncharacterized protein n=1 Tax=Paenibacillus aceris TaxID=869555 RepID=A0ABS4HUG6_9BACL|nr:hypothetical protein [Paenibacillus aceris]MBP1962264.1 hypothetical protein [Paenibacillus aceris]NHW37090.1 hypothetical protein [Paenibacillus aceris]
MVHTHTHTHAHVIDHKEKIIAFGKLEIVKGFYDEMRKTDIFYWYGHDEMMKFLDMEVWQEYSEYLRVDIDNKLAGNKEFAMANRIPEIKLIFDTVNSLYAHPEAGPKLRKTSMNELYDKGRIYLSEITLHADRYFRSNENQPLISTLLRQKFIENSDASVDLGSPKLQDDAQGAGTKAQVSSVNVSMTSPPGMPGDVNYDNKTSIGDLGIGAAN